LHNKYFRLKLLYGGGRARGWEPSTAQSCSGLVPPRYPTSAARPAYRCSLPGLAGFGGQRASAEPFSSALPTASPVGRGVITPPGFDWTALGTAPRASAPAYRRFRVPGDAEPPSLVRRHNSLY